MIVLTKVLTYSVPKEVDRDGVGGGFLPGSYIAEREDVGGIFFRGPARSQFKTGVAYMSEQRFALFNGGIWIPKTPDAIPRPYFYIEPSYPSVATIGELTRPKPGDDRNAETRTTILGLPSRQADLPLQNAANLIAATAIQTNVGKINFWPPIADPSFATTLLEEHKLAVQRASAQKR